MTLGGHVGMVGISGSHFQQLLQELEPNISLSGVRGRTVQPGQCFVVQPFGHLYVTTVSSTATPACFACCVVLHQQA